MDDEPIYINYTLDLTNSSNQIKPYETKTAKYLFIHENMESTNEYHSVILCPETKELLCFTPPKSVSLEKFKEKVPQLDSTILVNEMIEGTMINLFYDPRIQCWEIATKNAVGGHYWFYRNQYNTTNGKYVEEKQPTFRKMFLQVFSAGEQQDINDLPFLEYLSKDYSYSFVLQHPANHIVKKVLYPVLYLVGVYHLLGDRVVCMSPTVFEEWDCFLNIRGLIEFPKKYDEESYEELEKYCTKDSSFEFLGLMLYNLKTGERTIMENESYKVARELRGNHPNLHYQYLCLRNSGKVNDFLKYFPTYKNIFYQFYKQYNNYVTEIHQSYISYYIRKSGILISKKYFPLIYKIHHELFLPCLKDEKMIIRRSVINEFLKKIEPSVMIYYLNYSE